MKEMKKKLLIATHSVFADGIKNAMELVTGEQNSVSTLCAYTNDMTEVETPIKEIIDALCCPGDRSNDRCFVV